MQQIIRLSLLLCGIASVQSAGMRTKFLRHLQSSDQGNSGTVFIDAGAVGEDESIISGNVWLTQNMLPIGNVPSGYDEAVFMSHRSGIAPFAYTIGGFSAGELADVTLGFAENYVDNCSKENRVFSVTVNDEPFVTALDVYAVVGCQKALVVTKPYTANDKGEFVITFIQVKHHPMVSLIEIESLETGVSDPPSNSPSDWPSSIPSDAPSSFPSDVPSDMPSDAPSTVPSDAPSSIPSDAPSTFPSDVPSTIPSDSPSTTPSVEALVEESDRGTVDDAPILISDPVPPPSQYVLIDAGDLDEDESIITGNVWVTQNMKPIFDVPANYDESVFMSHRSGIAPFSYIIGGFRPDELADVTLGFAENYVENCSKGNRVFTVTVNDEAFATNLDVYDVAGCLKALVITKRYAANGIGQFVITFERVVSHPMVSMIEIRPFGVAASDFPSTAPSDLPSSLPSDVPSSAPSDVPSFVPSDAPSSSPVA